MITFKRKFAKDFGTVNSVETMEKVDSFNHLILPIQISFVYEVLPYLGDLLFFFNLCPISIILGENVNLISSASRENNSSLSMTYRVSGHKSPQVYIF